MAKFRLQEAISRAKEVLEQGDGERAIAMSQYVLRYYPRCIEAYRLLGEAYLERGDSATASRMFAYVVQADPHNVLAHVGRGIIFEERGDIDAAIAEFERAFELDPGIRELRDELVRLYTLRFGIEAARVRLSRAGLAHLYARDGLFPQAITEFNDALKADPRLDVRVSLAETLWRDGQRDEAARRCDEILQQIPNNLRANLILAEIWYNDSHPDDALALLERAQHLDPDGNVARDLYDSVPYPLNPPPLNVGNAELTKWDVSELAISSDLPVGLGDVVAVEDRPRPAHVLESGEVAAVSDIATPAPMLDRPIDADDALRNILTQPATAGDEDAPGNLMTQPPTLVGDDPLRNLLTQTPAQEMAQAVADSLPDELEAQFAPVIAQAQADVAETYEPESSQPPAMPDRDFFLKRLAGMSARVPATTTPVEAAASAAEVEPPAGMQMTRIRTTGPLLEATAEAATEPEDDVDWLERLAQQTRFDQSRANTFSDRLDTGRLADAPKRGFLDDLYDDSVPAPPPPEPPKRGFLDDLYDDDVLPEPLPVATAEADIQAAEARSRAEASTEFEADLSAMEAAGDDTAAAIFDHLLTSEDEQPLPFSFGPEPTAPAASTAPPLPTAPPTPVPTTNIPAPLEPSGHLPGRAADAWMQFVSLVTDKQERERTATTPDQPATDPWGRFLQLVTAEPSGRSRSTVAQPSAARPADGWMQFVRGITAQPQPRPRRERPPDTWMQFVRVVTAQLQPRLRRERPADGWMQFVRVVTRQPQPRLRKERPADGWMQFVRVVTAQPQARSRRERPADPWVRFVQRITTNLLRPRGAERPATPWVQFVRGVTARPKPLRPPATMPVPARTTDPWLRFVQLVSELEPLNDVRPVEVAATQLAAPAATSAPLRAADPPISRQAGPDPWLRFMRLVSELEPLAGVEPDEAATAIQIAEQATTTDPLAIEPDAVAAQPAAPALREPDPQPLSPLVAAFIAAEDNRQEETMPAPSYAEDDEQGRTFDFDWDKEGLPDYLKEFVMGDSTNLDPTTVNAASSTEPEADSSMDAMPDWLSSGSSANQLAPPAAAPAGSDLDLDGLPSWLNSSGAAAGGSGSQSQPSSSFTFDDSAFTPPAGAPSDPTSVQPFNLGDFGSTGQAGGSVQPFSLDEFDFGQPAASPPSASAQPFGLDDFSFTPPASQTNVSQSQPSNVQPFALDDFSFTPPALPPSTPREGGGATVPASNLQPFNLGDFDLQAADTNRQPAGDLQPFNLGDFDFGQPADSSPAQPAAVQPFSLDDLDFGRPADSPQPSSGAQPFSLDDFDFGQPADSSPAQPVTSPTADSSLDDLDGLPAWLNPQAAQPAQPASQSQPKSEPAAQPFNLDDFSFGTTATQPASGSNMDDLSNLEDFVDFLAPPAPNTTPALPTRPIGGQAADRQPFSFDDSGSTASGGSSGNAAQPFNFEAAFTAPASQPPAKRPPGQQPTDDFSGLQPFDLDDMGFTSPAPAQTATPTQPARSQPSQPAGEFDFGGLQPFNLADSSDQPASPARPQPSAQADSFDFGGLQPFNFDQPSQPSQPAQPAQAADSFDFGGLQPFNFDQPSQPSQPTNDFGLGSQSPFQLSDMAGSSAPAAPTPTAGGEDFAFAPFNLDEVLGEESQPDTRFNASIFEQPAPGTGARSQRSDTPLVNDTPSEVRGPAWQRPSRPADVLSSQPGSEASGSMFDRLRRRKEDAGTSLPPPIPTSSVPPVGAPLTDEERAELANLNWPVEYSDAPMSGQSALAQASPPAPPASPARQRVTGELQPTSVDDIAAAADLPELPAIAPFDASSFEQLTDDVQASANQQPTSSGSADEFDLFGLDLTAEERALLMGADLNFSKLDEIAAMQEQTGTGDYLLDLAPATAADSSPTLPAATPSAEFSQDLYDSFSDPGVVGPNVGASSQPPTVSEVQEAQQRIDQDQAASRERWAEYLASPPRPPITIRREEQPVPDSGFQDMDVDFSDSGAGEATTAAEVLTPAGPLPVEASEMLVDEPLTPAVTTPTPTMPSYVPPFTPATPPSSYVSPATPTTPPSSYVSPAASRPAQPPPPPSSYADDIADDMAQALDVAPAAMPEQPVSQPTYLPPTSAAPPVSSYVPPAPPPAPPPLSDSMTSISALREFVEQNKSDLIARYTLASAYDNSGDLDRALEQYRAIVKSRQVSPEVLSSVVGNLQELLTDEELSGGNPQIHRVLGDAYMKQGLYQHAMSQYNLALQKQTGGR